MERGVLAELGVELVATADVVEIAAGEHLELEVDERRLILAHLPLAAGVLGLARLLPADIGANLGELGRDGDGVEELGGKDLEEAVLHEMNRLGLNARLALFVRLGGFLRRRANGRGGERATVSDAGGLLGVAETSDGRFARATRGATRALATTLEAPP